jgi:hypothetical protein
MERISLLVHKVSSWSSGMHRSSYVEFVGRHTPDAQHRFEGGRQTRSVSWLTSCSS